MGNGHVELEQQVYIANNFYVGSGTLVYEFDQSHFYSYMYIDAVR